MPLRVELKPFEQIIIGETVIINSGTRTSFLIDGEAPILREKDTVTAETANTPVKRLYFCVQMMYLKNDIPKYRASYLVESIYENALVYELRKRGLKVEQQFETPVFYDDVEVGKHRLDLLACRRGL